MASDAAESRVKKMLLWLVTPIAIGLYISVVLSLIGFIYYNTENINQAGAFLQFINRIDQMTVDSRLKLRGTRPASESVGILAVDDRSIEIVGRWPWPRDKIGKAISNAFKYGAKVIAADIVWSEPSDRPEVRLIEKLSQENQMPGDLKILVEQHLQESDPDQIFANFIAQHKSSFILGNFFEDYGAIGSSSYQAACHDLIFKTLPLQQMVDNEKLPPIPIDSSEAHMPDMFTELYIENLKEIENAVRKNFPLANTSFEKNQVESAVLKEKIHYCSNGFLNIEEDEIAKELQTNWSAIKESIPGLNFNSFDEWAADFRNRNILNAVPERLSWTLNIPKINSQGEHYGYFNAHLDSDGSIRHSQLLVRTGSKYIPSIALQAFLVGTERQLDVRIGPLTPQLKGIHKLSVTNNEGDHVFDIPADTEGKMFINYAGKGRTIPHASIADLLNEDDPNIQVEQQVYEDGEWQKKMRPVAKNAFFKDKILVLGATAIAVFDLRVTPFDENFPGVETHANVVDNLLRRDFLAKNPNEDIYMPAFLLIFGFIISLALAHFGALQGLIFTVVSAAIILYVDRTFLFLKGHLVAIIFPLFQVGFTYMFLTFYKYFTEERSKKELRATFSKYVSPAIVEEILQDPKNLELGGRKEHVTVFFSDVRGFTTISEKLDPRALSDLLNSYLTPMTDLVFKNRGTLDKYMGDAIMAFFGAPVHYADHAKMACRCALQNLEKLKELQTQYAKKGLPEIDIGIGLNTGECSVGNMGSETVRSYTVMGDAVNLASRLEGINKNYGTHIIISEFTYKEVQADFICREVDWVRVKGKLKPVKIYELLHEGKIAANLLDMVKYFSEGYESYHERQFEKAIRLFNQALDKNPEDETSKIYVDRCQQYIAEPPAPDWDGVYVMKTK